jgi:hypothetical protein
MPDKPDGLAVWFASYPKSGNTWLRCLLEAYRCNGNLDINDIRISLSDAAPSAMQGVSPMSLSDLNIHAQRLLRPAALMHLFARQRSPFYVKTHWANLTVPSFSSYIPPQLTDRAIYVVRDPRQVAVSLSMWLGKPIDKIVEVMRSDQWILGSAPSHSMSVVSSWSAHAASWCTEEKFPVLVLKYEEMMQDAEAALASCIEFLGWKADKRRITRAVKAAELSNLQKAERKTGFAENASKVKGNQQNFFHAGGTRWQDELGPKWARQIESDHQEVMTQLGYLPS